MSSSQIASYFLVPTIINFTYRWIGMMEQAQKTALTSENQCADYRKSLEKEMKHVQFKSAKYNPLKLKSKSGILYVYKKGFKK